MKTLITGPYASGKTTLALALKALMELEGRSVRITEVSVKKGTLKLGKAWDEEIVVAGTIEEAEKHAPFDRHIEIGRSPL